MQTVVCLCHWVKTVGVYLSNTEWFFCATHFYKGILVSLCSLHFSYTLRWHMITDHRSNILFGGVSETSTVTHFDLALFNKTQRKMISCCLGSRSLVTPENRSNEDFLINLTHRGSYSWPRCFSWRVRLAKILLCKVKQEMFLIFSDKWCQLICGCVSIKSYILQGNGLFRVSCSIDLVSWLE